MSAPAPSSADRAFWKSLQTRAFHRVYYLYGSDEYLKEQAVRQLTTSAVDAATRDFNLDVRHAGAVDAETLGSLLATPPLMAERRVVVLKDAAALSKSARAVLDRYLDAPADDVVLVLVAAGGERVRSDRALADHSCAVEFEPLSGERVPRWIAHHAATELATTITPEAVTLLHRAVGDDLPALAAELDKLASYAAGGAIDAAAVADVVGVRRGETLGDFLDRVADRDALGALAALPHILEQPKTTAVSVVMALTTQTLALAWAQARREAGVSAARLDSELFDLLRAAGNPMTGRPWGEAVKKWAAAAGQWDPSALDSALDALLAADIALKETRLSSELQILSTLTLALCAGTTLQPATRPPHGAAGRAA